MWDLPLSAAETCLGMRYDTYDLKAEATALHGVESTPNVTELEMLNNVRRETHARNFGRAIVGDNPQAIPMLDPHHVKTRQWRDGFGI